MAEITVLDNGAARLVYHPDTRIVHHEFRTFMQGKEFRDVLTTGLTTMTKYAATRWLSDDRGNSALPKDDGDWANTVWFPQAVKAGWKAWAVVMPEKVIGKMNMQGFIDHGNKAGLKVKVFSNPDEAYRWLAAA